MRKKEIRISYTGVLLLLISTAVIYSCRKGDFKGNQLPDTFTSVESINLSGDNRLNSEVSLSWFGTDVDGYVKGFEISLDQVNWDFTEAQDSTFTFSIPAGQDTADIDFYVRAVDDKDAIDPSPAHLVVPLKNTAPTAFFDNDRGPGDTVFCAGTFFWRVADPDGNETIEKVLIRFNDGAWIEVDKTQPLISVLVDTAVASGDANGELYYGQNKSPESFLIDGLKVGQNNEVYVKAVDIAGAESPVDTADNFFLKNKTAGADLLWVSGHNASITAEYRGYLVNNSVNFDFLNYGVDQGSRQPVYWDPTFRLILGLYKKAFFNFPSGTFANTVTGQDLSLLEYTAPVVQYYTDNGGKVLTTTVMLKTDDVSSIAGPYPIESLVVSVGQVRIYPDSTVFPVATGNFPIIQPQTVQFGLTPIVKSADANFFYRANLTPLQNWSGDNLIAATRSNGGKITEAFFAIELHNYDKDPLQVEQLIGEILNNEF